MSTIQRHQKTESVCTSFCHAGTWMHHMSHRLVLDTPPPVVISMSTIHAETWMHTSHPAPNWLSLCHLWLSACLPSKGTKRQNQCAPVFVMLRLGCTRPIQHQTGGHHFAAYAFSHYTSGCVAVQDGLVHWRNDGCVNV